MQTSLGLGHHPFAEAVAAVIGAEKSGGYHGWGTKE
jgi:hypothetical protein